MVLLLKKLFQLIYIMCPSIKKKKKYENWRLSNDDW